MTAAGRTTPPTARRADVRSRLRSTGPVVIRPADGDDLEGVVAVGRAAWRETHATLYTPELIELFLDKWWTAGANAPAIRSGRTIVADRDGEIVGMASYGVTDGRFVVWKVYVHPDAQCSGIGGRLLEAVEERAAGHDAVYLTFTDGNTRAESFARTRGFVHDGREQQNGLPDVLWMRRGLGEATTEVSATDVSATDVPATDVPSATEDGDDRP